MKPTKHKHTFLKQICQRIPPHLTPKLARWFGAGKKAHSFFIYESNNVLYSHDESPHDN